MSEVIDFPNGRRPPSAAERAEADRKAKEERAQRERAYDVFYVRDALKTALTEEALQHISGADLLLIASKAVTAIYTARHERQHNPDYDQHRTGGDLAALDRMYMGESQPASSESPAAGQPDPEGAA